MGHGSTSANGDYYGDIFLSAEDGKQEGNASDDKNDIKLERGSGSDAYAQVGHGDFLFTSGKGASGNGDREGNIQIRAGSDVISDGGMIGHVDPKTSNGTSQDSNLVVAVSRDQPRSILGATILGEDIPPNDGVGRIIARNGASFAAPSDSQLRFYVPTREGVKVEAGTQINGMSFTPVKIDDPRTLFETARVQVTNGGITIIRPWVPLFQTATEDDPFFDSVFFESFVFYYDSLLADEPGAILDFIFESGFDNSRDRIEDLESALDAIPESSDFKIGFRPGDEAPNPYSTWWLVTLQEGDEYMLELDPSGVIYVWKMNNPDDPSDSDDLTVTEHTGGQDPLEGAE